MSNWSEGKCGVLDTYTVSFFGHRQIENVSAIEKRLDEIIRPLLLEKEYVEFLVGQDGEFDLLAASTIKRLKRAVRDDNSVLVWVLPYSTAEYRDYEADYAAYYDEIEICPESATAHFKSAFQLRNRWMVDRSNLVICYVERSNGGAFQALRYARRHRKSIIHIAELLSAGLK